MSQHSDDLRVRRTHKLLQEALIALLEEQSLEALTIGEIAQRAMVSRAAFYRYYQDKYDLVEKIFEEMITSLANDISPLYQDRLSEFAAHPPLDPWAELFGKPAEASSTPEPWVRFFEHIAHHERLYRALLGRKGSSWVVTKLRIYLTEKIDTYLQEMAHALQRKSLVGSHVLTDGFAPALLAAQLIDILTWWLEQERPYSPQLIATYYHRLKHSLLKEIGTWE